MKLFLITLLILVAACASQPDKPPIDNTPVCTYDEYYFLRPDVFKAGIDAYAHYKSHGKHENMCQPVLSICSYEDYYRLRPDVKKAGIDALDHYRSSGRTEGMCYPEKNLQPSDCNQEEDLSINDTRGKYTRGYPYPMSDKIIDIKWNWHTHTQAAKGADNWPITWADDDNQYVSYGDGNGFGGSRVSLGFAKISGSGFDNFQGQNLWSSNGKTYGIVSIDGNLYMTYGPGSGTNSYDWTKVGQSKDHGKNWTISDWSFPKSSKLIMPTILNYEKDYKCARDNYMYVYFIRLASNSKLLTVHKPGRIDLARVNKKNVMHRQVYEFFTGLDKNGNPTWSKDYNHRKEVFADDNGVGWNLSVSYNQATRRYILMTEHKESFKAHLGVFESKRPWGPWKTVKYYNHWGAGTGIHDITQSFFWNISNKWTNGHDFTLVFTGIAGMDAFNLLTGKFITK